MIIECVEVKNFRSIREARLDCDNLTAILGRNGAGKSSFLYAIETFYDVAAKVTAEDFFERDLESPIEIRVTYGALRGDELEEFQAYIRDDTLMVTKRIMSEDGRIVQRYYAAAFQIPQFAEIRSKKSKTERRNAWNELVESSALPGLQKKVKSADAAERLMAEYEANHPDMLEPIEREEQFFGPRNIGGGKLDKFTKYVLIPAVREASDEATGKKGAIYQILDMIVLRKINARGDIREFKEEFEKRGKELYSSKNLTELPLLGDSISSTLEKFAPGSKLSLEWEEMRVPEIPIPEAKATLVEDSFEGEITRKGHGLQRALIVTLLQHLAMTVSPERTRELTAETEEETSESKGAALEGGPDLILAIEEPELYLHPSRCRYLAGLLGELAEKPEVGLGGSNQVIYTSHSPYFMDLRRFDKVRIVRKRVGPGSTIPQSVVKRFSLEEAAKVMATVYDVDPSTFTRDSFRARATPIMNTIVNEGFFADVVVVVEGLCEVGTLWRLQELLNGNWSGLGIAVVPAGGKNNIDRPTVIFRGLSIPVYFIFDADAQLKGKPKKEKEAIKKNRRYLRLAGAAEEDFPRTQVQDTWAVFERELEALLKESLGSEVFTTIRKQVASELGYDDPARGSKNVEGAARFVEICYKGGHTIPLLEKIITKITKLRETAEG